VSDRVPGGEDMLRRWPAGGREGAVARLMALDSRGELATEHARAVAGSLGVSLRTVWNWVAVARRDGRLSARTPSRAGVTPDMRVRLAVWGGNVSAVHRELLAEAAAAGDPGSVPSLGPCNARYTGTCRRGSGPG
jgi:putative transposase